MGLLMYVYVYMYMSVIGCHVVIAVANASPRSACLIELESSPTLALHFEL